MNMREDEGYVLIIWISSSEEADVAACSKRRVTEEDLVKDDLKKSRVEGSKVGIAEGEVAEDGGEPEASKSDKEAGKETGDNAGIQEFVLGKR